MCIILIVTLYFMIEMYIMIGNDLALRIWDGVIKQSFTADKSL